MYVQGNPVKQKATSSLDSTELLELGMYMIQAQEKPISAFNGYIEE